MTSSGLEPQVRNSGRSGLSGTDRISASPVAAAGMPSRPGHLTLADYAVMMREAVKDRSYVDVTGLGRSVDGFLAYFRTERGKTEETCRSYEYCLAAFAVYYADLGLDDFDGKHGTNMVRDFLRHQYADVQGNTWNTRVATLKAFFKWAFAPDAAQSLATIPWQGVDSNPHGKRASGSTAYSGRDPGC